MHGSLTKHEAEKGSDACIKEKGWGLPGGNDATSYERVGAGNTRESKLSCIDTRFVRYCVIIMEKSSRN